MASEDSGDEIDGEASDKGKETTPNTHPENFENVKQSKAKKNKEKGTRDRAVWDNGRIKQLF